MEELIGKKIVQMFVNQGQDLMKFVTDDTEELIYTAYGDCCSESWFADILFSKSQDCLPFTVNSVEPIAIPLWMLKFANNDERCRQEYDKVYGYNMTLANQHRFEIIFRNSSNGYYGGEVCFVPKERLKETYWQDALSDTEWEQITGDWSA